jgi:Transposase DDE domain
VKDNIVWPPTDTPTRFNPRIQRHTDEWRAFYRGRSAVERLFGSLKHNYGLVVRVRGLRKVQLHADLVMLARLSQALARARAVPLAA